MLNQITIAGRLTKDPELRYTSEKQQAVASFTVAVDRDFGSKETDFIQCVAWRQTAEFISKYFTKGRMILVSGRLQSRTWTDRDGNKRTEWEINAENVYFGGDKAARDDGFSYASNGAINVPSPTFEELPDSTGGALPF